MSYLQLSLEFLEKLGVSNSDISVLFRLPKETNQAFNDFVKQEGLNNRLSENTKVIFLSGKIPKPLIESKIKTKSIINFSFYSIHHMVKNFIKNHQNVIEIKTVIPKKEAEIGIM
jgi:hypothetical protein